MFQWGNLLSEKRLSNNNNSANFDSDYKRIITSPAFRRLQDKTQVFPLERNDFIHTRLTHSIEVAMIARELAIDICTYKEELKPYKEKICRIVESASLLHDIGNPPFGHFGEDIIREWFKNNLDEHLKKKNEKFSLKPEHFQDLINFEGNAQALRIVTKLHNFSGNYGMNLTYATLNTMIKYTRKSTEPKTGKLVDKKIGFFSSEQDIFDQITSETSTKKTRHPLTFILEAADDIAYLTDDIEDAIEKNVVTFEEFKDFLKIQKENYDKNNEGKHISEIIDNKKNNPNLFFSDIRTKMINAAKFSFTNNYDKIMLGGFDQDLFFGTHSEGLHKVLDEFAKKKIFSNKDILKLEIAGHTILTFLLDKFIPAVILPEPKSKLDKKLWQLIAKNHLAVYEKLKDNTKDESELLYHRLLMVTDFISGMTDSYAHELYLSLSGKNI
ncbi:deoxyguanosinetriphosphate triphosphohydrolase [Actinobacillus porcitonsillarum]|uniref:Deoxyguanosinetriphosphate triphosphohydrolase n=1 Tax=Actinobacillus porcitonsillarum TaxID=189834 RepID=A0A2U8FJQ8_9PAST|nr:deoxyguanosinetriphosphate triphosphohydrolase [Actinobacillus porcitonsillarum]AWI50574.1 deoxyguanosinetriphosphate triphosphohydrolase [Actinobacillus porcitonsillarum]